MKKKTPAAPSRPAFRPSALPAPRRSKLPADALAHAWAYGGVVSGAAGGDSGHAAYRSCECNGGQATSFRVDGNTDAGPVHGTVSRARSYGTDVAAVYFFAVGAGKSARLDSVLIETEARHTLTTGRHASEFNQAYPGRSYGKLYVGRGGRFPDTGAGLVQKFADEAAALILRAAEYEVEAGAKKGSARLASLRRREAELNESKTQADAALDLSVQFGVKCPKLPDYLNAAETIAKLAKAKATAEKKARSQKLENSVFNALDAHQREQWATCSYWVTAAYAEAHYGLGKADGDKALEKKYKSAFASFSCAPATWEALRTALVAGTEKALEDWRAFKTDRAPATVEGAALRFQANTVDGKGEKPSLEVETSRGSSASVPLRLIPALLVRLEKLRRGDGAPPRENFHIGPFKVHADETVKAGALRVGCHLIPWSEIDALAACVA